MTGKVNYWSTVLLVSLVAIFWMSRNAPPKTAARETTVLHVPEDLGTEILSWLPQQENHLFALVQL